MLWKAAISTAIYTDCCCSCLAPRQVGATATGIAVSCRTKCRDEVSCARWALARSDGAEFRHMTEIAEAAMGACHEPDVQAPDAVPNAVPQALPLLRNRPEASAWGPWPERSSSIGKGMSIRQKEQPPMLRQADIDRRERICLCPCVGRFEVRCAAMHSPTLLRNAGGAAIGS